MIGDVREHLQATIRVVRYAYRFIERPATECLPSAPPAADQLVTVGQRPTRAERDDF